MNRRLSRFAATLAHLTPFPASGPTSGQTGGAASRWAPRLALVAIAGLCGTLALPQPARAASKRVVHYTFEQVWPAALRFLRLDEGCEIVERDMEAGYVIFDLEQKDKKFRGALEIIRIDDQDGKPTVRLIMRIDNQPNYTEAGLLRRFESKLRNELGEPRPRPPPAKGDESKKNKDGAAAR